MATIANIINLVECGLSATYGTGSEGCKAFFKNVSSLWLTPRGFAFDSATALDETYAQQLQAEGNLIVLKGVTALIDNSEEMVVETYDDGTEQVVRKGKYKLGVEFINGLYFQAALSSLSSFERYDISLVDSENNILGTLSDDGTSAKGFSTTFIQNSKYTWGTGSAGSKQGLMFQLAEPNELDDDFSFISGKSLAPFRPKNLDGVNEVVLSYASAPSNTDTTLSVKAVIKQGGGAFTGAAFGDFLLTVDGTTSNPTAGDDSTTAGTYELTVSAVSTNEVLALKLYDNSNNRSAVEIDNVLYKSNLLSSVVI